MPSCVSGGRNVGLRMSGSGPSARIVRENNTTLRKRHPSCVLAGIELPKLLGDDYQIDLLSIDIEGMESDVLRCFPLERVHAVLIETDKANLREVDRFFHRHGFASVETFINAGRAVQYLDNLYVRWPGGKRIYPPWQADSGSDAGSTACPSDMASFRGRYCAPWHTWAPHSLSGWDACAGK